MKELELYDLAANKFYTDKPVAALPILSADFYRDKSDKISKGFIDLVTLSKLAEKNRWATMPEMEERLMTNNDIIVVTDASLKIVHATHNLSQMNGYSPAEVIGKQPKMFQGKETCTETTQYISAAIKAKMPFEAILINYRKDGSSYKCWIKGQPVFDKGGEVINFIAFERTVA